MLPEEEIAYLYQHVLGEVVEVTDGTATHSNGT